MAKKKQVKESPKDAAKEAPKEVPKEVQSHPIRMKPLSRPSWTGSISFGLVTFNVSAHTMEHDKEVHFNNLHVKDNAPLKNLKICSVDKNPVPENEIVKGYSVGKDEKGAEQYVVFTEQEIAAAKPSSSKVIKVDGLSDLSTIDPLFFEKNYVIIPRETDEAYVVMLRALEDMKCAAVGSITISKKEHPVVIHAYNRALVMTTMKRADEVDNPLSFNEVVSLSEPNPEMIGLAKQILTAMKKPFDLTRYPDRYRQKIEEFVQLKREKKEIPIVAEREEKPTSNLMDALKASLAGAQVPPQVREQAALAIEVAKE